MGLKNIFKDLLSSSRKPLISPDPEKNNNIVTTKNGQAAVLREIKQDIPISKPQKKSHTIHKSKVKDLSQAKEKDSSQMKTVTVNNYVIRMFAYENQQYYCADDLAKASKMKNPEQFLNNFLINNSKINNELVEVEIQENGKRVTLQFATKEQIVPIIDAFEKVSPKTITFSVKSLN